MVSSLAACTLLLGCTGGAEPSPSVAGRAEPPATAASGPPPAPSRQAIEAPDPSPWPEPPPVADEVPPTRRPGQPAPEPHGAIPEIGPQLAARMSTSWRAGCPVPLSDLRYLLVPYLDMSGLSRTGELVVHADVAQDVLDAFAAMRAARFPIASMRLVDDFGGSDDGSMAGDNTSAFNCRLRTGGGGWPQHAYGRAVDVNPVENPYVRGTHVAPREGRAYVDRPDLPGVIHDGDAAVAAFEAIGWVWGGTWSDGVLDYQHFSANGR